MNWFKRKKSREQVLREQYHKESQALFEKRMQTIMELADSAMEQAHPNGGLAPVRSTVLIEYHHILRIWDIAERAKSGTCVR